MIVLLFVHTSKPRKAGEQMKIFWRSDEEPDWDELQKSMKGFEYLDTEPDMYYEITAIEQRCMYAFMQGRKSVEHNLNRGFIVGLFIGFVVGLGCIVGLGYFVGVFDI